MNRTVRVAAHDPQFGTNLVVNGPLDSDTDWTKGTGWTIAAGVATATAVATGLRLSQVIPLVAGARYRIVFTVSGYSEGGVRPQFTAGTTVSGTNRTADGTYTEYMTAVTGNTTFHIQTQGASTTLNIDNVSVQRAL